MSNKSSGAPGAPKEKEVKDPNSLVLIQANVPLFVREWLDDFASSHNRTRSNVINIILQAAYNARDEPVADGKVIGIKILGDLPSSEEEEQLKTDVGIIREAVHKLNDDFKEHQRPGTFILEKAAEFEVKILKLLPKTNGKYPELHAQLDHLHNIVIYWRIIGKGKKE